jgi:hypothetical protein
MLGLEVHMHALAQRSFSRAFRAVYDLDPSEYRAAERTRDEDVPTADTDRHDMK